MLRPEQTSDTIRTLWKASAAFISCLAIAVSGCTQAEQEPVELPTWLTEDAPAASNSTTADAGQTYGAQNPAAPNQGQAAEPPAWGGGQSVQGGVVQAAATTSIPSPTLGTAQLEAAPALDKVQLRLNLQPGMRLPLKKVIETELTQGAANNGLPEVHKSRLELGLILSVEERAGDQTRLGVRYHSIKLTRDAGGHRLEFDSANPIAQTTASPELVAYKSMVGDGFSYWVSSENRVVGVVGFQEFMNRCLGHMPDAAQRAAMLGIEGSSGEDGLADFVDSTIGLLPYNSAKAIGETWSREVSISRPVPMNRTETYTLKSVDPVSALVQVSARVSPSTSLGSQLTSEGGVRIVIEGGTLVGTSEIFLDSGLPKHSETTESLNMLVQMAGGVEFRQTKKTTTTISAYPPQLAAN